MSDQERLENARTTREAVDHVGTHPPTGPAAAAVDEAMRRYLAAEEYHQRPRRPAAKPEEGKRTHREEDQAERSES